MQGNGKLIAAMAAALGLVALDANATDDTTPIQTGDIKIFKKVNGQDFKFLGDLAFTFEIRKGATADYPGGEGTVIVGGLIADSNNMGLIHIPALPFDTYQVCEVNIPAGWRSSLSLEGGFIPNSVGNPNPSTRTVCKDVVVQYPWVHLVEVNNTEYTEPPPPPPPPPTAPAHTIGYWKNWSSCTGGKQDALLDQALAAAGGIPIGDLLVNNCQDAVDILSKSDLNGMKRATDAAYRLAAQLLGARLNFQAGAVRCDEAVAAANSGQSLLDGIGFTGTGSYKSVINADAADMLAESLDEYNNGHLCK
ncbi:hypothetical protein [Myxococcus sp. RHSTA-1-4]|uniref:hypothetical protein n=1 Tax=Myxococcus sp. RHSTA-1-4 TaxID=2874601 RepID=UPI001CBB3817|nr:hypothetical protein [Myxococcus sp. RHSTA-1-4]MBZ4421254.1 hypothetical protein [Myxococcus sp. RHSTA-1-4]